MNDIFVLLGGLAVVGIILAIYFFAQDKKEAKSNK